MTINIEKILYSRIGLIIKYIALFSLTLYLLALDLNFFITLLLIVGINILLVQIEFRNHLSTRMFKMINEKRYREAIQLGTTKNLEEIDSRGKIALMIAYYKDENLTDAYRLLKIIDGKSNLPKKLKKTLDYWKVKIIFQETYFLN